MTKTTTKSAQKLNKAPKPKVAEKAENTEKASVAESRRSQKLLSEKELYKASGKTLKKYIKEERRQDELERLHEVRQQKKVWLTVVALCGGMNLIFVGLAFWGMFQGAP